jgi:hypothetical protein
MNLKINKILFDWVNSQDENPKSYINRLVEECEFLWPIVSRVKKEGESRSIDPEFSFNRDIGYSLTPENEEKLRNLPGQTNNIFATKIRAMIIVDWLQDGMKLPQKNIPFEDFYKEQNNKKVDMKLINDYCDIEYELAKDLDDFCEMVLSLDPGEKYGSLRGLKFFPEIIHEGVIYRRIDNTSITNSFEVALSPFLINLATKKRRLGWAMERANVFYSKYWHELWFYQMAGFHNKNIELISQPISMYFASGIDRKGVLLGYPDLISSKEIRRNGSEVLHAENGPAISWGKNKYYALENNPMPSRFIKHPESITKDEFMSIENAELRRLITEQMGADNFVKLLDLEIRDEGKNGILLRTKEEDLIARDHLWFVKVKCPSTDRYYHIPVNQKELNMEDADEAVAWTFGMSKWEYKPVVQT